MKSNIGFVVIVIIMIIIGAFAVNAKENVPNNFSIEYIDAMYPEDGMKIIYNQETISLFCPQDSSRYEPIVKLGESKYLITYDKVFDKKSDDIYKLKIGIDYIWHGAVSIDKKYIAVIGKNQNDLIEVGYYSVDEATYTTITEFSYDSWGGEYEPMIYIDFGKSNEIFYDSPDNGVPTIMYYDIDTGENSIIKKKARLLEMSDDGAFESYLIADCYTGGFISEKKSVIMNKKSKEVIEIEGYVDVSFKTNEIVLITENVETTIDKESYKILNTEEKKKNVKFKGNDYSYKSKDKKIIAVYNLE